MILLLLQHLLLLVGGEVLRLHQKLVLLPLNVHGRYRNKNIRIEVSSILTIRTHEVAHD